MKKQFSYFIIILVLIHIYPIIGFGQDFIYKNYSVNDGLPSSEIYHCLQDSKGYIWFATDNGVSKFDGYKFVNFDIQSGLVNNTILDIYEDWHGRIWFISLTGQLCYYQNSKIEKYIFNDTLIKSLKGYKLPVKQSFYIDSLDNLYIGIRNYGILKISPNGEISNIGKSETDDFVQIKSFGSKNYISGIKGYGRIKGIVENNKKNKGFIELNYFNWNLIFGLQDLENKSFISIDQRIFRIDKDSLIEIIAFNNDIIWFSRDRFGNFWLSVRGQGIRCYQNSNFAGNEYTTYLGGKDVSSIMIDNENNFWFTSINEGLYYLPSNRVHLLNMPAQSNLNVLSVETTPHNIWLGMGNGELIAYDKNLTRIEKRITLMDNDLPLIISYHKKFKKLFIGTIHSLYRIEGLELHEIKNVKNNIWPYTKYGKTIRALVEGKGNYLYAGTNHSIDKLDENHVISASNYNAFSKTVYAIYENSDSSYWIGTQEGLWKYQNGQFVNWALKNSMLSYRISALFIHKNTLFIGTRGAGLVMLDMDDNSITSLTIADGLSNNSITTIVGNNDDLWIATTNGINQIKFLGASTFQLRKINIGNIHSSDEINQLVLDNKMLYIATKKGLKYINLDNYKWSTEKPRLYVEKVEIDSKDTSVLDSYEINYQQNNFKFSFVAVSLSSQQNIAYKYRLLPIQKEWKSTYETSVNYTTLPPGKYKFEIKAFSENGIWSNSKVIIISIDKPFWLKWWFYLIIFCIIVSIIFIIIYNRIKSLKYHNKLKNELNENIRNSLSLVFNDHFIFNSLNSLNHLILIGNKPDSSKLLTKFSNYIRAVLYSLKKDFISLSDEINLIRIYLGIEKQRLKDKFNYSIEVSGKLNLNQLYIPGILIQPFIEVFIWSVNPSDAEQLKLEIEIGQQNENLNILIKTSIKSEQRETTNGNNNFNKHKFDEIIESVNSRAKLINELYKLEIVYKEDFTSLDNDEKLIILEMPLNKLLQNKLK